MISNVILKRVDLVGLELGHIYATKRRSSASILKYIIILGVLSALQYTTVVYMLVIVGYPRVIDIHYRGCKTTIQMSKDWPRRVRLPLDL